MSSWEEVPGQTQNTLEGLHVSSGLGTPQDPLGGTGKCHWGQCDVSVSPLDLLTLDKQNILDGYLSNICFLSC